MVTISFLQSIHCEELQEKPPLEGLRCHERNPGTQSWQTQRVTVHLDQMTFTLRTQDINAHRRSSKRQVSPPSSRLDCIVPHTSYLSTWEFLDCAACIYAESFPVTPRAARKWPGTAPTPVWGTCQATHSQ